MNHYFFGFEQELELSIKTIFDSVVCTTWHVVRNQAPLVAKHHLQPDDLLILCKGPLLNFDFWVQLGQPSLATLLACPAWNVISDSSPFAFPIDHHVQLQELVFFVTPSRLGHCLLWFSKELQINPFQEGLRHISAENFRDKFDVFLAINGHTFSK